MDKGRLFMNLKYGFKMVVDYVQNLLPKYEVVPPSDNPDADVNVLAYMAAGNSFFIKESNDKDYWYFVPKRMFDEAVAKYIMQSNGLNPQKYKSTFLYPYKTDVFRVPVTKLSKSKTVTEFVIRVVVAMPAKLDVNKVHARIDEIKKILNQNTK